MFTELITELLKWMLYYVLAVIAISYIFRRVRDFVDIQSRWHYPFDGMQYSSQEFYAQITQALEKRKIPDISINRITRAETYFFLSQREYLEVVRGDQKFLICAAPFANGFFVSYWFGKSMDYVHDFVTRIPWVGEKLALFIFSKTYFQMDTDTMFFDFVKSAFNEAVDHLSNEKGFRPLTEMERMPTYTNNSFQNKKL